MQVKKLKANKDYPNEGINKGDYYYKWSFRNAGIFRSKEYPTRNQLTQSDFLLKIYEIEDNFKNILEDTELNEISDLINDSISELQDLSDECQEKIDNLPESFQDSSPVSEKLQNRIDSVDVMISELESIVIEEEIEKPIVVVGKNDSECVKELSESNQKIEFEKKAIFEQIKKIKYEGE